MNPSDYISPQGALYCPPRRRGCLSVDVLPMLIGRPWDEVSLGLVHSLRPHSIRVVNGSEETNSVLWRVTVHLEGGVIQQITQEVEVGLPDGVEHGQALSVALRHGGDRGLVPCPHSKSEAGS